MDQRDVREILNEVALATAQSTTAAVESGTAILAPGALTSGRQKVIRKVWDAFAANRIVEEMQNNFSEAIETCAQKLTTSKNDTPTVRGDLGYYFLLGIVKKAAQERRIQIHPEKAG
jgi:hypothetical protein